MKLMTVKMVERLGLVICQNSTDSLARLFLTLNVSTADCCRL